MRAWLIVGGSFLLLLGAACNSRNDFYEGDDPDPVCRHAPHECDGDIGGACVVTDDCSDGVCCHDDNCGGGMCTYICYADLDCPPSMGCEHGFCFFLCSADNQCGPGQKCEHGNTICEYD